MKSKYILLATLFCSFFIKADEEPIQIDDYISFSNAVGNVANGYKDVAWLDQSLNANNSSYCVDTFDLKCRLLSCLPYESKLIKHTLEHHNFKNKPLDFSCMSGTLLCPSSQNTRSHQEYQDGLFPLETLKVVLSFVNYFNGYEEIVELIKGSHFNSEQKELALALIQKRYNEIIAAHIVNNFFLPEDIFSF